MLVHCTHLLFFSALWLSKSKSNLALILIGGLNKLLYFTQIQAFNCENTWACSDSKLKILARLLLLKLNKVRNKSKYAQWTDNTTLSHIHPQWTIKWKLKEYGREMQIQDNTKLCYWRGNRRTWQKISPRPSKMKSIHKRIKLEYMNSKRPSKPSLPYVLGPSKLLLSTDFSKSCLL